MYIGKQESRESRKEGKVLGVKVASAVALGKAGKGARTERTVRRRMMMWTDSD